MLELKCFAGCAGGTGVVLLAREIFLACNSPAALALCSVLAILGVFAVVGTVLWYLDQKESVERALLAVAERRNRKVR